MPTFAFKTRTRTVSENCALDLVVQHRLVAGEPSNTLLVKKRPPPQGIDIILVSPLAITISGMLNGTRILPSQLKSSCIAQHLPEYLRMVTYLVSSQGHVNSSPSEFQRAWDRNHFGPLHRRGYRAFNLYNFFSETSFRSTDLILAVVVCTASRPSRPTDIQFPHLKLLGFDIDYIWHEDSSSRFPASPAFDTSLTPFSRQLALPFLAALNNVIERFVAFQAVRCDCTIPLSAMI